MNLPNAITLSRLLLTAIFGGAVSFPGTLGYSIALVTFSIAAATDWLDGHLARKLGLVTPLGKLLDPLADKILVASAFVYFSSRNDYHCPVWVTSLIIGREFLVTGLRQIAIEAGQVLAADRLGKWKTAFQLTFCITGLVYLTFTSAHSANPVARLLQTLADPQGWIHPVSLWGSLALTLISGANYLWSSRQLFLGPR